MVERAALEMPYIRKGIEGSNPSLSARRSKASAFALLFKKSASTLSLLLLFKIAAQF